MSNFIGKIVCDPVTPRPAVSVRIEVFDTDDLDEEGSITSQVFI